MAALLDQVAAALAATGSLTLVAGALVLVGAVAAGQRRRTQEAVILKTLGATRAQIRAAWLVEFGVLGLAAGLIAALVGTAGELGRWCTTSCDADWVFLPGTLAATLSVSLAMMLVFGYAGTAAALRAKAGAACCATSERPSDGHGWDRPISRLNRRLGRSPKLSGQQGHHRPRGKRHHGLQS